jgi:hypothetical protein
MSGSDDTPDNEAAGDEEARSALPPPLREHLGQQLRTAYDAIAEKPAFLGDANVPPELDQHLQRLETREKVHHQGVEAVRAALQGGESPKPAGKRDQGRRGGS